MKSHLRFTIPGLMIGILLLAGCNFNLMPPNIPRTGDTPTAAAGTGTLTPAGSGLFPLETDTPAGTAGQAAANTAVPANTSTLAGVDIPVVTATPIPQTTNTPAGFDIPVITATANSTSAGANASNESNGSNGSNAVGSSGVITLPPQRAPIQFPANATSYVVTVNLQNGAVTAFQLGALNGQRLFISIDGNASMQLYDPNLHPLSGILSAINPVQISLSQNGTYYIALQGSGPVVMSVYIPPVGGNQNVAAPIPAQLNPIQFQTGASSASFSVNASPSVPIGYTLNVQAGQTMTVVTTGNATFTLLGPDRATMIPSGNAPTHQWVYPLTQAGQYTLVMFGTGPVTVTVTIPPVGSPQPTVQPTVQPTSQPTSNPGTGNATRINIPAGNASVTLNASLTAGTPKAYVLRILAGQTLYVSTTGVVDVTIYSPSNTVLTSGHARFPTRWAAPAVETGDYTFVVSGSGTSTLVFYIPPL